MKNGDGISDDVMFVKKPKGFGILALRVLVISAFMRAEWTFALQTRNRCHHDLERAQGHAPLTLTSAPEISPALWSCTDRKVLPTGLEGTDYSRSSPAH